MKPFICKRLGWYFLVVEAGVSLHSTLDEALASVPLVAEPTA